jgi:hypothetical protein
MIFYTLSFVACMVAKPTACKPVEIQIDGGMQACMVWSQQAAADWQNTWGRGKWFVKGSEHLRCIPPMKKKEENV